MCLTGVVFMFLPIDKRPVYIREINRIYRLVPRLVIYIIGLAFVASYYLFIKSVNEFQY
jgi:hypothetical protein